VKKPPPGVGWKNQGGTCPITKKVCPVFVSGFVSKRALLGGSGKNWKAAERETINTHFAQCLQGFYAFRKV
jgi:hypothetical protein